MCVPLSCLAGCTVVSHVQQKVFVDSIVLILHAMVQTWTVCFDLFLYIAHV